MNPELLIKGQLAFSAVFLVVSFAISLYSLYLNYQQSKVTDLISEVKELHSTLKRWKEETKT